LIESTSPRDQCYSSPRCPSQGKNKTKIISRYISEGTISFNDEDAEGIVQPHNDALVISVLINKSRVKRILINPGSSANIIRSRVVEQLGPQDQIVSAVRVLNKFNMACETTKTEITLSVNTTETFQEMKFYAIEGDMRYNAIFERPWIHNMRTVPSTLHQTLKFPTPGGIKMVYGEQPATIEILAIDEVISMYALSTSKNTEPVRKEETKYKSSIPDPTESDKQRAGEDDDYGVPRSFITPDDSDSTKSTVDEL